jgi:hypothetical protein
MRVEKYILNQIFVIVFFMFSLSCFAQKNNLNLKHIKVNEIVEIKNEIFIGTHESGVLSSKDGGKTWIKINSGLPNLTINSLKASKDKLYAIVKDEGLFIKNFYGSWDKSTTESKTNFKNIYLKADTIFGITSTNDIYFTKANSISWKKLSINLYSNIKDIVIDGNKILLITKYYGIVVFNKIGEEFVEQNRALIDNEINSILVYKNQYYAGTQNGIYISKDKGKTWDLVDKGLEKISITKIVSKGDSLIAGTNPYGLIYSVDEGEIWSDIHKGISNPFINSIFVNKPTIFVGTDFGMFYSKNNGKDWIDANLVDTIKKTKKIFWRELEFTNIGYQIGQPAFKSGITSLNNWDGIFVESEGISAGYMSGMVSFQDSNRTVYLKGMTSHIGSQQYFSFFKSKRINICPYLGGGLNFNRVQNPRKINNKEFDTEAKFFTMGWGFYATGGLAVVFGPVIVKAQVQAIGSFSTNKANEFKKGQLIPMLTIAFRPLDNLMKPDILKAKTSKTKKEIVGTEFVGYETRSYVQTLYQNWGGYHSPVSYNVTETKPQYRNIYENVTTHDEEVSKNIRKHFFIGMGYEGKTYSKNNISSSAFTYNTGFRFGKHLVELGIATGNFAFKDPIKRNGSVLPYTDGEWNPNYALPRMDGAFMNSSRVGIKYGYNLMGIVFDSKNKGGTKEEKEKRRKMEKATEYFAVFATIGFGVMDLGNFQFADTLGHTAYLNYINPDNSASEAFLSNIPLSNNGFEQNQAFTSFGLNMSYGAVSLEYNLYRAKGKTLTSTIGVALKIPIFRIFYYWKK